MQSQQWLTMLLMGQTTPKLPFLWEIWNHLIHGSLGQPSNGISIGSVVFAPCDQHTERQRQTDHATCEICRNKPHLSCDRGGGAYSIKCGKIQIMNVDDDASSSVENWTWYSSISWPAQSPNMNIIVNIWQVLKGRVLKDISTIKYREDLILGISKCWPELHSTIFSISRRTGSVGQSAKQNITKYWLIWGKILLL